MALQNSAFLFILTMLVLCSDGDKPSASSPNIVLIIADDLGWADVGYNGAKYYETPNIDQLASEGMIFNRFYPSAANCAPSRSSIMTGLYSPRHHVYLPNGYARRGNTDKMRFKVPTRGEDSTFFTFKVNNNHVAPEYMSLAELLKQKAYVTARLGKWHIGDNNQGFDSLSSAGVFGEISNMNGTEGRYYDDIHVAQRLTDAAIEFIEKHQNEPFFVYLSHWEVHTPMAAQSERVAYYKQKLNVFPESGYNPEYAAEVEQVDISLGRIMKTLSELGLDSNTLVIFTSDNGGLTSYTNNAPLRGGKGSFYEGGIRVPACMKWTGTIKPGSKTDIPVSGIDFLPTFAEISNSPLPTNQPVDGKSFAPLIKDGAYKNDRDLYFHFPLYLGGTGKAQVLPIYHTQDLDWRAVPSTTVIRDNWKLIYYYEYDSYELFNLKEDIGETKSMTKQYPEIAEELLASIKNWTKQVKAPIPKAENSKLKHPSTNER